MTSTISRLALSTLALAGMVAACAQGKAADTASSITPKQMADALHAVMEADRTVYTRNVVNRLQNDEQVIKASEHWQDDKALDRKSVV